VTVRIRDALSAEPEMMLMEGGFGWGDKSETASISGHVDPRRGAAAERAPL
jgi:hypothetical protein